MKNTFIEQNVVKSINKLSAEFKDLKVYAVGGFARDALMGSVHKHKDIDLSVNKDALKFAKRTAELFDSNFAVLDKKEQIYRIIFRDSNTSLSYVTNKSDTESVAGTITNIDISLLKGKTIEDDLQKRDFTINAFAFDLQNFEIFKKNIIYVNKNSLKDLKTKTINTVSKNSFKDDALRMLRAFRFAAELNLQISKPTFLQIKKFSKNIKNSATERIKAEFFRILSVKNSSKFIEQMDSYGLLAEVLPEIKVMKNAKKKYYYHPKGLFQHSLETVSAVEKILNNLKKFFPKNFEDLQNYFNEKNIFSEFITRGNLLKFAALFHDNAKPETAKFDGKKMRFFEHEKIGAGKIKKIMYSLKCGNKAIETVKKLIENHMRPSTLTKNEIITKRAALRFFRDMGDETPSIFILSMADWISYKRLKIYSAKQLKQQQETVAKIINYYYELKKSKPLKKIIDGNIIMKKFNLKPGPLIGDLLEFVKLKQKEGKISSTKEALAAIKLKLEKLSNNKQIRNIQ